jgi:hypothetical protein
VQNLQAAIIRESGLRYARSAQPAADGDGLAADIAGALRAEEGDHGRHLLRPAARRAGTSCAIRSRPMAASTAGLSMMPGATTLAVTPRAAYSSETDFTAPISPALAAA